MLINFCHIKKKCLYKRKVFTVYWDNKKFSSLFNEHVFTKLYSLIFCSWDASCLSQRKLGDFVSKLLCSCGCFFSNYLNQSALIRPCTSCLVKSDENSINAQTNSKNFQFKDRCLSFVFASLGFVLSGWTFFYDKLIRAICRSWPMLNTNLTAKYF